MAGNANGSDELVRARRKLVALERAKFRLRQRMESIDFELDVLKPMISALETRAAKGELPEFTMNQ